MRGQLPQIEYAGVFPDDPPDGILAEPVFSDSTTFADGPKQRPRPNAADRHPVVEEQFRPGGNGDGADTIALPEEIG